MAVTLQTLPQSPYAQSAAADGIALQGNQFAGDDENLFFHFINERPDRYLIAGPD